MSLWKKCHALMLEAFRDPVEPANKKALKKVLGKSGVPIELDEEFLSWQGFLLGMGRMSLSAFVFFLPFSFEMVMKQLY